MGILHSVIRIMDGMVCRVVSMVLLFLLLSACGGGGSGGGSSLTLSLSPNPLTVTAYQWDLPVSVKVDAQVSGSTSSTTYYVVVTDSNNTFQTGNIAVTQTGPTTFYFMLTVPASVTVGVHPGNLVVNVCGDAACGSVLTSSTLPYTVTVQPNPAVSVTASPNLLAISEINPGILIDYSAFAVATAWQLPTFTFAGTPAYPVYVTAYDPAGLIALPINPNLGYEPIEGPINTSSFQLEFAAAFPPVGEYKGAVQLTFCQDSRCAKKFTGSLSIPYDLKVGVSNTPPLKALPGATDWRGLQGGPAHTGNVPSTLDATNFSPRWIVATDGADAYGYATYGAPITSNNNLYIISQYLTALSEADGSFVWGGFAGLPTSAVSPSMWNGGIYMVNGSTSFVGINASNGTQIFPNQTVNYWTDTVAPVVSGAVAVVPTYDFIGSSSNRYLQLTGINAQTGAILAAPSCLSSQEEAGSIFWQVAMDAAGKTYFSTSAGLMTVSFGSGGSCSLIPYSLLFDSTPLLLESSSHVLVRSSTSPALVDFNTKTQTVNWSVTSETFSSTPDMAYANGVIYVVNGTNQLEARSEEDGRLLWTWDHDGLPIAGYDGNIIATGNLVFVLAHSVNSNSKVYAIDTTTHAAVWALDVNGGADKMSISANGVLYVDTPSPFSYLTAVNLH